MRLAGPANDRVAGLVLLAPPVFVCHFLEEGPGFVQWFNSRVSRGTTPELFWTVNVTALVITIMVAAVEWFSRSAASLALVVAWLSFLFLANALLHVVGAVHDGAYVPGLLTAVFLYLPYSAWLAAAAVTATRLPAAMLATAGVVGSIPMLVHGYLILFQGSRLF